MLADKLDRYLAAHHKHGWYPELRPGATDAELDETETALGLELPEALRALWSWRNGHVTPIPRLPHRLVFRDINALIGTPEVLRQKDMLMIYQPDEEDWRQKTFDISKCIPIAAADGATTAVSCAPHGDAPHIPNSVIEVHQGIGTGYESIEAMIDTNIEWMETWDGTKENPRLKGSNEARRKHNPLLFRHET